MKTPDNPKHCGYSFADSYQEESIHGPRADELMQLYEDNRRNIDPHYRFPETKRKKLRERFIELSKKLGENGVEKNKFMFFVVQHYPYPSPKIISCENSVFAYLGQEEDLAGPNYLSAVISMQIDAERANPSRVLEKALDKYAIEKYIFCLLSGIDGTRLEEDALRQWHAATREQRKQLLQNFPELQENLPISEQEGRLVNAME